MGSNGLSPSMARNPNRPNAGSVSRSAIHCISAIVVWKLTDDLKFEGIVEVHRSINLSMLQAISKTGDGEPQQQFNTQAWRKREFGSGTSAGGA